MKYFKPESLTWWASFAPFIAGVFIATEPLHHLTVWAASVDTMTGSIHPAVLINAGLAGIGLRAAL